MLSSENTHHNLLIAVLVASLAYMEAHGCGFASFKRYLHMIQPETFSRSSSGQALFHNYFFDDLKGFIRIKLDIYVDFHPLLWDFGYIDTPEIKSLKLVICVHYFLDDEL